MTEWKFSQESVVAGANTYHGDFVAGHRPHFFDEKSNKRNVIATEKGWVRRTHRNKQGGGVRQVEEVLIAAHPGPGGFSYASNTHLGWPDIAEVFLQPNTATGATSYAVGTDVNVYVVFTEPMFYGANPNKLVLTLANTVSGNGSLVANSIALNSNSGIQYANNVLVFKFKSLNAQDAGTYKIGAQVMTNTGFANLRSLNTGNELANLTISGPVSNSLGTFTIV